MKEVYGRCTQLRERKMPESAKKKKGPRYRIRLVCPPWLRWLLRKDRKQSLAESPANRKQDPVYRMPASVSQKENSTDARRAKQAIRSAAAQIEGKKAPSGNAVVQNRTLERIRQQDRDLSAFDTGNMSILRPVAHRSESVLRAEKRQIRKQTRRTQRQLNRQRRAAKLGPKRRMRRRRLVIAAAFLTAVALIVASAAVARLWQKGYFDEANGYVAATEVYFDGLPMGAVPEEESEQVRAHVEALYRELGAEYGVQLLADQELVLKEAKVDSRFLADTGDVTREIKERITLHTDAYVIDIDGMTAVAVENEEDAEWILDRITEPYRDLENMTQIGYVEDVKIKRQNVSVLELVSREDAYQFLMTGVETPVTYVIQPGDTIWGIAQRFGYTEAEILETNPQLNPSLIYSGMKLTLMRPKCLVNVEASQVFEEKTVLPYETERHTDSSMYDDERIVQQKGQNGEMTATVQQDYVNGVLVERTILKEEITAEPVKEIVVVGTKTRPSPISAAGYMQPVSGGHITSDFGSRTSPTAGASSYHYGLDIGGVGYGATIVAARGGTVTYAGWSGGYGYMVEIDHGDGVRTHYGHCSTIMVSSGQHVDRGTAIALVGSTGVSTGPHLHFEVRINGTAVDPSGYVDIF